MIVFKEGIEPLTLEIHYMDILVGHLREESGKYRTTFYGLYFIDFPIEVLEAIVAKKKELEAQKKESADAPSNI